MSKRYKRMTKMQAVQKLEPHRGSVILTGRPPKMPEMSPPRQMNRRERRKWMGVLYPMSQPITMRERQAIREKIVLVWQAGETLVV